jgi:hypothetical protein
MQVGSRMSKPRWSIPNNPFDPVARIDEPFISGFQLTPDVPTLSSDITAGMKVAKQDCSETGSTNNNGCVRLRVLDMGPVSKSSAAQLTGLGWVGAKHYHALYCPTANCIAK